MRCYAKNCNELSSLELDLIFALGKAHIRNSTNPSCVGLVSGGCVDAVGRAVNEGHMRKRLYPTLSQYTANRAQTVQSEPNGAFGFQQFTSEPVRNHPFC